MSANPRFPNLYLAGAPKCGTTSLASWLGEHPDIFSPIMKEPLVFASDLTSRFPRDPEAAALEHFGSWRAERYALDATTHYFFSETAADEIAAACPQPHVYMLVRNPTDAVHSMYHQLRFNGAETLPTLNDALDAEQARSGSLHPIRFGFPENLLYSSVYAFSRNIARFERAVGPSRLKIILFDDLIANPPRVTRSIFDDLGIDASVADAIDYSAKNAAKRSRLRWIHELATYPPKWAGTISRPLLSKQSRMRIREWLRRINTVPQQNPELEPETRQRLNHHFRGEVEWLSEYLNRDLSDWSAD